MSGPDVSAYRTFSDTLKRAIERRATDGAGRVNCERCGLWVKSRRDFEIDHVIAERMRPDADKRRKLVAADGQLLCVAVCHPTKTREDVGLIATCKRRERKAPLRIAGQTQIQRRFGL
jgi:hypothetical protein